MPPIREIKKTPHLQKMKTTTSFLFALLCGTSLGLAQGGPAQDHGHRPPPPPPFFTSGSNSIFASGTDGAFLPPPPLPPWFSGSNGAITSGTDGATLPPPPCLSGSNGFVNRGANNPPPVQATSFEALNLKIEFAAVAETSGTGATAAACLKVVNRDGTISGSLNVNTKGLVAGTYTVSATTASDATEVTVGTFTVVDVSALSATRAAKAAVARKNGRADFGGNGIAFPDGFDAFDIASLAIADADGNVLFTADLTSIADGSFCAHVPITPGALAPDATGFADIKVMTRKGALNGLLAIRVSGVPAGATYTYSIDGVDIGTVTSTAGGRLKICATSKPANGTLPYTVNLFNVTTVTVHDDSGGLVLSASF
jgi:hypothetical protein